MRKEGLASHFRAMERARVMGCREMAERKQRQTIGEVF